MADKLHRRIVEEGAQFRAECYLVDGADGSLSENFEVQVFQPLQNARVWLEQQSHSLGYDRIWLDHDTGDAGPLLSSNDATAR